MSQGDTDALIVNFSFLHCIPNEVNLLNTDAEKLLTDPTEKWMVIP